MSNIFHILLLVSTFIFYSIYPITNEQRVWSAAEQFIGKGKDNKSLYQLLHTYNPELSSSDPWCAAFVNAILDSTGIKGTNELNAKSYLHFGIKTNHPQQGDIVVLNRKDPEHGHVGFVDYIANGKVYILGGNQDHIVKIKGYSLKKVAGFREVQ